MEKQINAALKAAAIHPETSARRKVASVLYHSRGCYEVTDINGNVEFMKAETVEGWVK